MFFAFVVLVESQRNKSSASEWLGELTAEFGYAQGDLAQRLGRLVSIDNATGVPKTRPDALRGIVRA
jgi:hypothetical protein